MELITKKQLIASVAERWRIAHQRRDQWLNTGTNPQHTYQKLLDLPPDASETQIIAITGDNRWTQNICFECGADSDVIVAFGAETHHPTDTAFVCLSCLEQAIDLARAAVA